MYIKKYWGNFIGGSDDSLNLVAFLEDQKKEEIPLSEIFAKIGLDKQNWDFRQTVEYLEFTHSDGVEMDFHFAIDVVTDLAAILLECSVSGSVNLQDLDEYNTPARRIRITATPEEHDAMNKSLADFGMPSALCCWWPPVVHTRNRCLPPWRRTGSSGSILWSPALHQMRSGCGPCFVGLPGGSLFLTAFCSKGPCLPMTPPLSPPWADCGRSWKS